MNIEFELRWYKQKCNDCGKVYKSTSKRSICPDCNSENVVMEKN